MTIYASIFILFSWNLTSIRVRLSYRIVETSNVRSPVNVGDQLVANKYWTRNWYKLLLMIVKLLNRAENLTELIDLVATSQHDLSPHHNISSVLHHSRIQPFVRSCIIRRYLYGNLLRPVLMTFTKFEMLKFIAIEGKVCFKTTDELVAYSKKWANLKQTEKFDKAIISLLMRLMLLNVGRPSVSRLLMFRIFSTQINSYSFFLGLFRNHCCRHRYRHCDHHHLNGRSENIR